MSVMSMQVEREAAGQMTVQAAEYCSVEEFKEYRSKKHTASKPRDQGVSQGRRKGGIQKPSTTRAFKTRHVTKPSKT